MAASPSEAAASEMPSQPASEEPSLPTAKPTAVDPSQVITPGEAANLAGVSFGKPKCDTLENNSRRCLYTAGTTSFTVAVTEAPDQATVDAAKKEFLADLEKAVGTGVKEESVSGIGDGAELVTVSGKESGLTINGIAMYLLKGTVFVAFIDAAVGQPVASSDAMKAEAQTVVGRLP